MSQNIPSKCPLQCQYGAWHFLQSLGGVVSHCLGYFMIQPLIPKSSGEQEKGIEKVQGVCKSEAV